MRNRRERVVFCIGPRRRKSYREFERERASTLCVKTEGEAAPIYRNLEGLRLL
jgi:hypothetical protein